MSSIFEKYEKIYEMHKAGNSIDDISKELNTGYANAALLIRRAIEHHDICINHPFYLALIKAITITNTDECITRRIFNTIYYSGRNNIGITIELVDNHDIDLNTYSDEELLTIRGVGKKCLKILRIAQYIYNNEPIPDNLFEQAFNKNYVTGKDVCQLIKKYNLTDKKLYIPYNGFYDELWFCTDKDDVFNSLHIFTGELMSATHIRN